MLLFALVRRSFWSVAFDVLMVLPGRLRKALSLLCLQQYVAACIAVNDLRGRS